MHEFEGWVRSELAEKKERFCHARVVIGVDVGTHMWEGWLAVTQQQSLFPSITPSSWAGQVLSGIYLLQL